MGNAVFLIQVNMPKINTQIQWGECKDGNRWEDPLACIVALLFKIPGNAAVLCMQVQTINMLHDLTSVCPHTLQ